MIVGLRKFGERLLSTYWLIPSLLICGQGFLAVVLIEVDRHRGADLLSQVGGNFYRHSVDGSRQLLSVGAAAMAAIATTAFSIVIVALQLASSQYGPRVLKSFFRDRGAQCVLGSLIGTVVYCFVASRRSSTLSALAPNSVGGPSWMSQAVSRGTYWRVHTGTWRPSKKNRY